MCGTDPLNILTILRSRDRKHPEVASVRRRVRPIIATDFMKSSQQYVELCMQHCPIHSKKKDPKDHVYIRNMQL